MHLQNFFFLILLASVFEWASSEREDRQSTSSPDNANGWNWDENYRYNDNNDNYYGNRQSYNDGDRYGSKGKKPSSKDNDDHDSRGKKPSSKNDDDDDDYYSSGNKPSYKDDDDNYSRGNKQSYKDNDDNYSRGNRPSYNDDDDDDDQDYRPSKSRSSRVRKSPDEIGNINIYMRDNKKRKPKRMRFPVARYERNRFPSFGPLISFLPWLPIFTDRLTKQTFIYSPTGGVYICPPVINFYGDLISIAELIASGYASLVSTGAPPPPAVNIAPLVQPGPVVGPNIPAISTTTGGFKGGVSTQYRFTPRAKYPKVIEEDEPYVSQKDQGRSYPDNNYSGSQRSGPTNNGDNADNAY